MPDLPQPLTLTSTSDEQIKLAVPRKFGFDFHWLREVALGNLVGDLGLTIGPDADASLAISFAGSFLRVISTDERGRIRLELFRQKEIRFDFAAQVSVTAQVNAPSPGGLGPLAAAIMAAIDPVGQLEHLPSALRSVLALRDSIYQKAAAALERKYAAEVVYRYGAASGETALLDVSFDPTEDGLRAYRQALAGDYSASLTAENPHVEVHRGVLTHSLTQEASLELHLPYLDRKEWSRRLEALARMEVQNDGEGRLLVYHVEAAERVAAKNSYQSALALAGGLSFGGVRAEPSFTLSFESRRQLPSSRAGLVLGPVLGAYGFDGAVVDWADCLQASPASPLEVSLSLTVPGSLVRAWLDAPGERTAAFFPVYSRVSIAVQQAMRRWLPYVYFEDLARYEALDAAFPLVVYQASRPSGGRPKTDFTYDVLIDQDMSQFFQSAGCGLRRADPHPSHP